MSAVAISREDWCNSIGEHMHRLWFATRDAVPSKISARTRTLVIYWLTAMQVAAIHCDLEEFNRLAELVTARIEFDKEHLSP